MLLPGNTHTHEHFSIVTNASIKNVYFLYDGSLMDSKTRFMFWDVQNAVELNTFLEKIYNKRSTVLVQTKQTFESQQRYPLPHTVQDEDTYTPIGPIPGPPPP